MDLDEYEEPFATLEIEGDLGKLEPKGTMFAEAKEEVVQEVPEPFGEEILGGKDHETKDAVASIEHE